jgi:hypothetical protein
MDPHAAVERSRTFMSNSSALNSIWAGTARFRTSLPCRSRAGRYRSRNTWVGNNHEVRRLLVLEPGRMALGDLAAKWDATFDMTAHSELELIVVCVSVPGHRDLARGWPAGRKGRAPRVHGATSAEAETGTQRRA